MAATAQINPTEDKWTEHENQKNILQVVILAR
jgi:hypothetical protein